MRAAPLPWKDTSGFTSGELEELESCYLSSEKRGPWVGYGYTERSQRTPMRVFLFVDRGIHHRLVLTKQHGGAFELATEDGQPLWCGTELTGLSKILNRTQLSERINATVQRHLN